MALEAYWSTFKTKNNAAQQDRAHSFLCSIQQRLGALQLRLSRRLLSQMWRSASI